MLTWDSATPEQKMEIVTLAQGFNMRDRGSMSDFGMAQWCTLSLLYEKSKTETLNVMQLLNDYSASVDVTLDSETKAISVSSLFSFLRYEQEMNESMKRISDINGHLDNAEEDYALHVCAAEYALEKMKKDKAPADDLVFAGIIVSRLRDLLGVAADLENDSAVHDMLRQFVDRVGRQAKAFRRLSSPLPGGGAC